MGHNPPRRAINHFGVNAVIIAGCLVMIAVMLIFPDSTSQAATAALRVWGLDVAPSLFPYMVFCRMLTARLRSRSVPAVPTVLLLGWMGGSPSGAAILGTYAEQGRFSPRVLSALIALTGTISPMFLLNTVRPWVQSDVFCQCLLGAHLLGALFSAAVAYVFLPHARTHVASTNSSEESSDPIAQSVMSILGVGGCIVFFSVLSAGIEAILPGLPQALRAGLHALLEVAGGVHALTAAPFSPFARAVLCAAASGFSGLSILTQNLLLLRPLGLGMRRLCILALLRAFGAGLTMAALYVCILR